MEAREVKLISTNGKVTRNRGNSLPQPDVCAVGEETLVGNSPALLRVVHQIDRVASRDVNVVIHGESGTGKELIARAIHAASPAKDRKFVTLNCAALPDGLQESELFGHERGSFTGAVAQKPGLFEIVDGGTMFLDEVAELSLAAQAKLLRVLQQKTIQRVGGTTELKVSFRLVTATHRDLREDVADERFRADLYYRMAVFDVVVPPLRDRASDIPLLIEHFLDKHADRLIGRRPTLSREAIATLTRYRWPGNVRELENAIQRALVLCNGTTIRESDLPGQVVCVTREGIGGGDAAHNLWAMEKLQVLKALEASQGNRTRAAHLLGIGRNTLYRKLRDYGVSIAEKVAMDTPATPWPVESTKEDTD